MQRGDKKNVGRIVRAYKDTASGMKANLYQSYPQSVG